MRMWISVITNIDEEPENDVVTNKRREKVFQFI